MGNGTLSSPFIFNLSFNATFSGGSGGSASNTTVTINYRRTTNGTQSLITLIIPAILVTTGTSALTIQTGLNAVPLVLVPATTQYLPVPIRINTVSSIGMLVLLNNGAIAIVDGANSATPFPANTTNCGILLPTQVTYAI
jgi:hypothetical protein